MVLAEFLTLILGPSLIVSEDKATHFKDFLKQKGNQETGHRLCTACRLMGLSSICCRASWGGFFKNNFQHVATFLDCCCLLDSSKKSTIGPNVIKTIETQRVKV